MIMMIGWWWEEEWIVPRHNVHCGANPSRKMYLKRNGRCCGAEENIEEDGSWEAAEISS